MDDNNAMGQANANMAGRQDADNDNANQSAGDTEVTVYTTQQCPYCHMVKDLLKENGVEFTEKDVQVDAEAHALLVEKYKAQGVPLVVITVNGSEEVVRGFDADRIRAILGI